MKKKWICAALLLGAAVLAGCGGKTGNQGKESPMPTETSAPTPTPTPFVPEVLGTFEAEEAALAGNVKITKNYVEGFQKAETDTCTFTVTVEKEGFYDLIFRIPSRVAQMP
ncbi:MAG: hypothetical protein IJO49_02230 [Clostridia bacterium]|nr:hypothetical protein [Clostridia bacterium]